MSHKQSSVFHMIRKYVLSIWSGHNYIFSHRIVHWVYNYMFRPCILTIVRLYCKLNKQLYRCAWGTLGGTRSRLTLVGGVVVDHYGPALILYIKMNVRLFVCVELVQIHISDPIWTKLCTRLILGLQEVVGYVWTHNISTFPPFRPLLSGASADLCAEDGCRRQSPPLLRYIRDAARVGVTSRTWRSLWVMRRRREEVNGMHVCENGNLMRREGSS